MPVLHRPEVVDIGVNTNIEKHAICLKDYRIRSFLSIQYVQGDLCKHLGIDSSTDHSDCHVHAEYLKMIELYSPLGIWHVFLYSINTNIYHFPYMKYRQYA